MIYSAFMLLCFSLCPFSGVLYRVSNIHVDHIYISTFQMSEQLNQELALTGKIPSGLFNMMFEFSSCWQKDAAYTKTLAFDGMFITLYTVALEKSQMVLKDHVKKEVPSTWEPAALARYVARLPSLDLFSNITMLTQSLLTF